MRVNYIQPAATNAEMLVDGFRDDIFSLEKLKSYHPLNRIATPIEIAETALFPFIREIKFYFRGNYKYRWWYWLSTT